MRGDPSPSSSERRTRRITSYNVCYTKLLRISVDENAIKTLCANYIDNVKAHTQKEKIRNKYSNKLEEADERFMRSIEEKIDIPESRKDDFRREIMNYIGALAIEGKTFDYKMNERLHRALDRITSYNVCYTKLLRILVAMVTAPFWPALATI